MFYPSATFGDDMPSDFCFRVWTYTHTHIHTGRAKKSNPLGKIRYLWNCSRFFPPSLQRLQMRIQATYPANFIKTTDVVQ